MKGCQVEKHIGVTHAASQLALLGGMPLALTVVEALRKELWSKEVLNQPLGLEMLLVARWGE